MYKKDKFLLLKGYIGHKFKLIPLSCTTKKELSAWKTVNISNYRRKNVLKDSYYYALIELDKVPIPTVTTVPKKKVHHVKFKTYNSVRTYIKGEKISNPSIIKKKRTKSILVRVKIE
jgi:hypothetical protein